MKFISKLLKPRDAGALGVLQMIRFCALEKDTLWS